MPPVVGDDRDGGIQDPLGDQVAEGQPGTTTVSWAPSSSLSSSGQPFPSSLLAQFLSPWAQAGTTPERPRAAGQEGRSRSLPSNVQGIEKAEVRFDRLDVMKQWWRAEGWGRVQEAVDGDGLPERKLGVLSPVSPPLYNGSWRLVKPRMESAGCPLPSLPPSSTLAADTLELWHKHVPVARI
jgi:hypothetical protein